MKMTLSKDGIMRATIRIPFRVSEDDQKFVAFVNDYNEDKNPRPTPRLASRAEVVEAIKTGFMIDEFWKEDISSVYWKIYDPHNEDEEDGE